MNLPSLGPGEDGGAAAGPGRPAAQRGGRGAAHGLHERQAQRRQDAQQEPRRERRVRVQLQDQQVRMLNQMVKLSISIAYY